MKKSKIIASVLAAAMVVTSVPFANLSTSYAGIGATANVTKNGKKVTGYNGDKTSLTRMIIDSDVTEVTTGAFYGDKYPNLKEVSVLGDNTVIDDMAFGYTSAGVSQGSDFVVWCNPGSKAESYANAAGLTVKYLNTRDMSISNLDPTYYSGCGYFKATVTTTSEDIVWQIDDESYNNGIVWFKEGSKKTKESAGTVRSNSDNTYTSEITVYVVETAKKKNLTDVISLTANCRGNAKEETRQVAINKATKNIKVDYLVVAPCKGSGDKDANKYLGRELAPGFLCMYADKIDEGTLSDEDLSFYASKGDIILVKGIADEDSNDYLRYSVAGAISSDFDSIIKTSNFYNVETGRDGKVTNSDKEGNHIQRICDKDGNALIDDAEMLHSYFVVNKESTSPVVTVFSSNNTLSKPVNVTICVKPEELTMSCGGEVIENGHGRQFIEGDVVDLKATFKPNDTTAIAEWSSSNETVAQIKGNTMTILNRGEATIKCKVKDKLSGKTYNYISGQFFVVALEKVAYTGIAFAEDETRKKEINELYVEKGATTPLYVCDYKNGHIYIAGKDETAANESLIFTSSDEKIATVDETGKITGKGIGTVTITVAAAEHPNVNASITVKVYAKATNINITSIQQVVCGQEELIPYTLSPDGASEDVNWVSSNEGCATVEDYTDANGKRYLKVTGKAVGTSNVTGYTYPSDAQKTMKISVVEAVHASQIAIKAEGDNVEQTVIDGNTAYKLPKGKTMTLEAVLTSAVAGKQVNDKIEWVVQADQNAGTPTANGNTLSIYGKSNGSFNVTLVTKGYDNGKLIEKKSTVIIKVVTPATAVSVYKDSGAAITKLDLPYGTTTNVFAKLTPNDSNDVITWSCNNDIINFAKNQTGNNEKVQISATRTGKAVITATAESGKVASCEVNVYKAATDLTFVQDGKEVTTVYVPEGETTKVSLLVNDADTTDKTFTWTVSSGGANYSCEASADGLEAIFTGIKASTSTYQVNVKGNSSTSVSGKVLQVKVYKPIKELELGSSEYTIYKGYSINIVPTMINPADNTDVLEWTIVNEGVAKLDRVYNKTGYTVKAVAPGTTKVIVSTKSGLYETATITVKAKELESDKFKIKVGGSEVVDGASGYSVIYNGKAWDETTNAKVTIIEYDADEKGNVLKDNNGNPKVKTTLSGTGISSNFDVTYSNNINVGIATIHIHAKETSNYFGDADVTFKINPKNIPSIKTVAACEFGGKKQQPVIEVEDAAIKVNGENYKLVKDVDYEITYGDSTHTNVSGSGIVIITGKGNYTNTQSRTFSINRKDLSKAKSNEIVCSTKLTDVTYTGSNITKEKLAIKYGSYKMVEGTDYRISYQDADGRNVSPRNVGLYKVVINGSGSNFMGSFVIGTFRIKARSIATARVTAIANVPYTGSAIKKTTTVKLGNITLSSSNDYTITYAGTDGSKCIKPGQVKVTFKGKGNYTGSVATTYVILPPAPKNAKMASCTTNTVKLTWGKSAGASGYYIYLVTGGKEKKIGSSSTNSYTVKKLASGKDYEYRIYSYVKVGTKYYNGTTYAVTKAGTKTATPVIATVKSTVSKKAVVTWKKVTGASKYTVYYSTSKNGSYKVAGATSSTSYNVSNLVGNKVYYFKIKAERYIVGKTYYSALSAVKSVKVKK